MVILIPALLILPQFLGIQGVFISGPISDFCSAVVSVAFVAFSLKRLQNEMDQELSPPSQTSTSHSQ
ncbi:hypothetical protein [Gracilibacillus sp. JCM 18860]|uniref:hypothetical protein n=1 Tax=Gracilibacillus sp. JCM 18860 TaxID=1306159 RepID=UPI000AF3140F